MGGEGAIAGQKGALMGGEGIVSGKDTFPERGGTCMTPQSSVLELVLDHGEEWKNRRSEEWKNECKTCEKE